MRFFLLLILLVYVEARRHRRNTEVGIVNLADANVRIRCQSVILDQRDRILQPNTQFRFRFLDIDRGNHHFWCDAYGLFGFDNSFDVFGREAPSRSNVTWFLKPDGLYLDRIDNKVKPWSWNYPPFSSYAE